jgi:dolichyl-phosphate-mannose-protein mannosyltransferase
MSSPAGVRHRGPKEKKRPTTPNPEALTEKVAEKVNDVVEKAKREFKPQQKGGEWDYKLAITIITILAFITRFWGIQHPTQVVFDEVHFGKVCRLTELH